MKKRLELVFLGVVAVALGVVLLLAAGPYIPDAWKPGAGPHVGGEVGH